MGLKREGMPSDAYISDFVSQFAEWGWDDFSSALALQVLANVRNSHWDETFAYADADFVEVVAQDLGNDWIEGLVILDAKTGDILLDVTGVERADGSQYVGLQDTDVAALRELGLELIFIHNHPNGTKASYDDLKSAFDAGAKLLIVITSKGQEYVYIRGRYGMVEVRDEKASYEVGLRNPEETEGLRTRSEAQARKYLEDSPEYVFLQEDPRFINRLRSAAEELKLDTALPVSALINLILNTVNEDVRAFGSAAVEFYGYGDTNIAGTAWDFKDLLGGATTALPYWKTAEMTGVDPALLAQLVLWEDSARSLNPLETLHFESAYYFFIQAWRPTSLGPAQIKVTTAVDMLTSHPEAFDDFSLLTDGLKDEEGNWSPEEVARQLWHNREFSIRVAWSISHRDLMSNMAQPYLAAKLVLSSLRQAYR